MTNPPDYNWKRTCNKKIHTIWPQIYNNQNWKLFYI